MQSTKKENKKQKQLPPAKPELLQAKVLSPHEIEKEFLLKKIETLRYNVKNLQRENEKLLSERIKDQRIIDAQHRSIANDSQRLTTLMGTLFKATGANRFPVYLN